MKYGLLGAALLLAGCQVLETMTPARVDYTALPAEAVEALAQTIEEAVVAGDRSPALGAAAGASAESELVRQAIRTRAARYELVDALRATGHAYEARNGLLTIQRSSEYKRATTSRERDRNALLVMGENNDRWNLYEGLVKENGWPPDALGAVKAIFHKARVAAMPPGQKYEDDGGAIMVK